MLVLEQGVPDLITISPEQKSYGGWRRRRGSESSDEGSKEPARRSVLSENDSAKLPVEPLKLQPCLRRNSKDLSVADVEDIYQVEERPRRRTWFDMRAPAVRVVAGDSGWWRPADLESFRVRLLKVREGECEERSDLLKEFLE